MIHIDLLLNVDSMSLRFKKVVRFSPVPDGFIVVYNFLSDLWVAEQK